MSARMSDKWHNLFHRDECPHDDLLTRYIMDELSADERHQVERHALDCPSCSDALEGLQQHHSDYGNTAAHLASLGENIDAHVNAENKGSNWRYWSAAATVAALVAVAWWVWSSGPSEQVLAEKVPAQDETQPAANGQATATDSVALNYKTPQQTEEADTNIATVSKAQIDNALRDEGLRKK
ncbi:MAG: zf-HC2 domain-containing protein, partial [Bacteroidota bacterium]